MSESSWSITWRDIIVPALTREDSAPTQGPTHVARVDRLPHPGCACCGVLR